MSALRTSRGRGTARMAPHDLGVVHGGRLRSCSGTCTFDFARLGRRATIAYVTCSGSSSPSRSLCRRLLFFPLRVELFRDERT
jgi:hypothetical protein